MVNGSGRMEAGMAILILGVLCLAAGKADAQASGGQVDSMEMHGSIGPYPVGLNYTVRNQTALVTAHYFYVSQNKNILLTGAVQGSGVDWKGADGSVFQLHFVGNGSQGAKPLTFFNSIGLAGTWTQGSRTLPVKLSGEYSTENPGTRLYEQVTAVPDATFEAHVGEALKAILAGDRTAAARYVDFPLSVYRSGGNLKVRNAAELDANWAKIFTSRLLSGIQGQTSHEMFVQNGQAMIGDGQLWFDAKGLTSVNVP